MTREDFSKSLRQFREASGVGLKELLKALNSFECAVYRIEKGAHSYGVDKAIIYAKTVNANIYVVTPDGNEHRIDNVKQATSILKEARGEISFSKVARDNGYSTPGIIRAENGVTVLSIDMFLKLSESYNLDVILR